MLIAGVDEAGRGPLAGDVYAAAVILPDAYDLPGLTDSKKLSAKRRDSLAEGIKSQACAWAIASASVAEIDQLNILQASLLAMQRAITNLSITPDQVQVDGNRCPILSLPCRAIVGGDRLVAAISAASILAKTARDAALIDLDAQYPEYGFAQHKGYPTTAHLAALARHGASAVHRHSFKPVKQALERRLLPR